MLFHGRRHIAVTVTALISLVLCQFFDWVSEVRANQRLLISADTDVHEYRVLADPRFYWCCWPPYKPQQTAVSHPFFCLINGPDAWPWPSSCTNDKQMHKVCANLALVHGSDPSTPWQFVKEVHRHRVMAFFLRLQPLRWLVRDLRCSDLGICDGECKQDSWGKQLMIEEIRRFLISMGDSWQMQW